MKFRIVMGWIALTIYILFGVYLSMLYTLHWRSWSVNEKGPSNQYSFSVHPLFCKTMKVQQFEKSVFSFILNRRMADNPSYFQIKCIHGYSTLWPAIHNAGTWLLLLIHSLIVSVNKSYNCHMVIERYIYSSCYYHHQIGSINLTHCCHIFRGCVPGMFVTSHSVTFCIYIPGKPGFCFNYYCAVYDVLK